MDMDGDEMGWEGVNQDGDCDKGMGFDHLGTAPPLVRPKKSIRTNSGRLLHTVSDRGP